MSVPGVARVAPSLDTVLRLSFARRVAPALLATRTIATTCERRPAPSASPVTCSICLPHILSTHGSGSQHRSIHRSVRVLKSKRSFAASVDEDLSRAVDEDVQVMRTKGKGAKAAKASLKSSKTKRGNKEAQEKDDGDRYATSTRNSELPGETFDSDKLTENMLRTVERCRSTISHKVGMIGRVDPSLLDDLRVTIGKDTSSSQPLREIATVGARNGVLFIHCFDSSYVKDVEKAIYASQLNLAPQVVSGDEEGTLRVPVPKPTVETRKELLKDISRICESARVSIRSARHAAQKQIKADIDGKIVGSSEGKALMKKMEDTTKKFSAEIDQVLELNKKKIEASIED